MARTKVLIVDDQLEVLDLLGSELARYGFYVRMANCSESACEVLSRETFDVILADICMPDFNGLELKRLLGEAGVLTTCIAMSGLNYKAECMAEGFSNFLAKPFAVSEVVSVINILTLAS